MEVASIERDGTYELAFVFRYRGAGRRVGYAASVVLTLFGAGLIVASAALSDGPGDPFAGALIGLSMLLFFGATAVLLRRDRFGLDSYVALVPAGIVARSSFSTSFVPWDAIVAVAVVHATRLEYVGLELSRPDAVQAGPRALRVAGWQRQVSGYDLGFPVIGLIARPELLAGIVRWYVDHPAARAQIGTADGLHALAGAEPRA